MTMALSQMLVLKRSFLIVWKKVKFCCKFINMYIIMHYMIDLELPDSDDNGNIPAVCPEEELPNSMKNGFILSLHSYCS